MSQFDDFPDRDDEEEYIPSKTDIKKEMAALQDLGTKIVELSDKFIARIPIEGELADAIHQARGMKHREGRRRQLQFIGKLMRKAENIEEIKTAYERVISIGQEHTKIQHQTEHRRDRLLEDGNEALQTFVAEYPHCEVQYLRQLIRNSQKEQSQQKAPTSARKLFRYIRDIIEA
ncbi:ribosome biogenesis factor YjgA [Pseudomaricurvus sp.]|uniref:ribosome biogenesis factor YjgA n=1 Tax=Pseudomaricurvus sp. TaxID=2004510 RepID=UPI003F6BE28E